MEQVLEGLDGVRNLPDDIIIASANDEDHVKHVRVCLRRLSERGLTLNRIFPVISSILWECI